jgi:hypothetical protein
MIPVPARGEGRGGRRSTATDMLDAIRYVVDNGVR